MAPLSFSVVIPTYDRPEQLARCVASVGRIERSSDSIEIIVVNDGGTEPDAARLGALAGQIPLTVVSQHHRGPGAARNNGVAHASGEYIVLLDDDCLVPPEWLTNLATVVRGEPDAMVGGRTVNVLTANPFSEASQTLVDYLYDYYNAPAAGRTPLFASNNVVFPAAAFRAIGGFDESFRSAEDRELCRRWHERGGRSVFTASVVVLHSHRLALFSFLRQHFTYGRGAFHYWESKSPGIRGLRMERRSFYTEMLPFPLRQHRARPVLLGFLIGMTQLANAAGFAFEAGRRVRGTGGKPLRSAMLPAQLRPAEHDGASAL